MHNHFEKKTLKALLKKIYKDNHDINSLTQEITDIILNFKNNNKTSRKKNNTYFNDAFLITYPDSISDSNNSPLKTLNHFLNHFNINVNSIHILPFMPSSSDSGFSVIDYTKIDTNFGNWGDLSDLANKYSVMIDLVLNHTSQESEWFKNFQKGSGYGYDYFIEIDNWQGIPQISRPRTSEIFKEFKVNKKNKKVWCTFSHDQIDLNFKNPQVLIEFIKIFIFYLEKNIQKFRLDAIAYIWKEEKTNCINRPESHYIVKVFRLIVDYLDSESILVTETNIPNKENLSYFGNNDEAHWIYNFTLSPLILYTLSNGNSQTLRRWSMTMPPAKHGNSYFNFLASHDGIGLRPLEGYVEGNELNELLTRMESYGGKISYRTSQWGDEIPYEINISLLDSFKGTVNGLDAYIVERFLCAHLIMFSFEGVPAIYIHSLLGTRNNYESIEKGFELRAINRYRWNKKEIFDKLNNPKTINSKIFKKMNKILEIRSQQPAFDPEATQFTLNLGNELFGIWRQDKNKTQSIFCISNVTNRSKTLTLTSINLIEGQKWWDLITENYITDICGEIALSAYQSMWITNKDSE